ncbi:hypothetical protein EJ05DRAFT_478968 [Pseudovirgaria hyperparasitica]|uniref:Uncharacterized protein n=1 Tax=Pseudovirgaria hyperparasitica TaxID=470096 RepID=A0A6A6VZJ4_9PEZI|nr:uncharacterized protein EJ05DRAFT_478968 [Pseudovirgaria hyperparasitica]KAF2755164.1 hypothetical protein EJ05DRAFT_478968 [Pseudovirgaria hyperparasitica]
MFCLRSWIPILFFLSVSNASPIYLILFVVTTYLLNRPCVYCSLLLGVLVLALFDFSTDWFAPSFSASTVLAPASNSSNTSYVEDASALVRHVTEGVRGRLTAGGGAGTGGEGKGATWIGEWVRNVVTRKEWRVPCLDVVVRL